MNTTLTVTLLAYMLAGVLTCGFLAMLGKLEVNKWIATKINANMNFITRASMLGITLGVAFLILLVFVTASDPARMAKYLTNVFCPILQNIKSY